MKNVTHRILLTFIVGCVTHAAAAQISVRSSLSDDRDVRAGATYEGVIQVWNETDEFQQAKIYQTDYRFYADGSNYYGDPGQDERSNANWIRVSAATLSIPPNGRIPVGYLVEVPDSANGEPLNGSYWSMIMVEAVPKESPEALVNPITGEPQYSVLQITRYGVQVATHVSGTGESRLAMSESRLEKRDDGAIAFQVNVENTGSRMIRPTVWLELYDDDGNAYGRHEGTQNRIYPGTSVRQEIRLSDVAPGHYRALIILDGGISDVFGAEYRLEIE